VNVTDADSAIILEAIVLVPDDFVQVCLVNTGTGTPFISGLRQGDPLSPFLFNIVADMLAMLVSRARENGQIEGVVPHLIDGGLSILQYADDTIIFLENDMEQAKKLKLLMCAFEELSGLKINFHKNEVFCLGDAKGEVAAYVQLFGCKEGTFPF